MNTAKNHTTKNNRKLKAAGLSRFAIGILTVILIALIFCIMSLVGKIQGTARVVNYAGLVRGKTQRIIKLEDAGQAEDEMIDSVASYIDGLRFGSTELNLVRLDDSDFQAKMTELNSYFTELRAEIRLVRENGYENTAIIEMSEHFFGICDEATGLAEAYSQRMASSLNLFENAAIADIVCLLLLFGVEIIRALRYAAQNRILQSKVYLDEATGLPNKNKCEELLDDPHPLDSSASVALCVFDLNNLRTINNNLGHNMGDLYIRSFAVELRKALPAEYFAGRDGGDEFLAILKDVDHSRVKAVLSDIRAHMAEYSRQNPMMPISYAVGYAISTDFEDCTMRDLFRYADKNMYIDKNRSKIEEAAATKRLHLRLLDSVKEQGFHFSACLYCDALQDQYQVLRAGSNFFLADDGSYSGAVEQIVDAFSEDGHRKDLWQPLQLSALQARLTGEQNRLDLPLRYTSETGVQHGRLTLLFTDADPSGHLHHFLLGFEFFHDSEEAAGNEKIQLARYYEDLKQSILENGNYVDALMETANAIFTVDLTNDCLENIVYPSGVREFDINPELPCSYTEYCRSRQAFVTEETLENYRIVDSSAKLLERFHNGMKQITVEYQETGMADRPIWLQRTVLLSQDTVYDSHIHKECTVIRGIILFKNTSVFHEKEEAEHERLQAAFLEADTESRAKTDFMNRMSHDIRTPINGIMGMLDIIQKNREDQDRVDDCLRKIRLSSGHLLALINDVLDMNKLQSDQTELESEPFDLLQLMTDVSSLVNAQLTETGIRHTSHREHLIHTRLIGSPLKLRQIMLNLFSNSIKYNKPGGTIDTYSTELSWEGDTAIFEFKIRDTGIGMSEHYVKEELFKPFTQEKSDARTQYRGTGLGMSIVNELIKKMGGSIQVESTLGEGTLFTFQLPFQIDPASSESAASHSSISESTESPADQKDLSGLHILLVEDNDLNMEIAEFYLLEKNATLEKAWNGQEALEKFKSSPVGTFDLILMDVMMPVMDGLEATRQIRKLNRPDASVPILAMTAQVTPESLRECRTAGMNDRLSKPFDPEYFTKIILRTLSR